MRRLVFVDHVEDLVARARDDAREESVLFISYFIFILGGSQIEEEAAEEERRRRRRR